MNGVVQDSSSAGSRSNEDLTMVCLSTVQEAFETFDFILFHPICIYQKANHA